MKELSVEVFMVSVVS